MRVASDAAAGEAQRERDVLAGREVRDEVEALEHLPDPGPADPGDGALAAAGEGLTTDGDGAGGRSFEAGGAVEQGALARAGGAHDGGERARAEHERDAGEGVHDARSGAVGLGDLADLECVVVGVRGHVSTLGIRRVRSHGVRTTPEVVLVPPPYARRVPDYGHELEFGVFLPPDAVLAAETLELAQLADVLGYELVTVQDHPYQAKHLDAWTLLSAIAARTSAVRVAPNVANLPLRPPAVLAQAVATLDILSDGRAELGLGTGAFWDAIVAVGGPRRSPGEAVQALEEAIAIIRGAWGLDGNRTVDVDGEHYRVKGMHAGPVPLHDVQIWLGALKPRMLRLTGRLADGWLPSLGSVTPETMGEMNAVIDEAADRAGRGPQAVRRMLNVFGHHEYLRGPSAHMAERLAALTLEHGTSTFILGTEDPDELRRFAAEVIPAVRSTWSTVSAPVLRCPHRWLRRDEVPSRNQRRRPRSPPPPPTTAPASP